MAINKYHMRFFIERQVADPPHPTSDQHLNSSSNLQVITTSGSSPKITALRTDRTEEKQVTGEGYSERSQWGMPSSTSHRNVVMPTKCPCNQTHKFKQASKWHKPSVSPRLHCHVPCHGDKIKRKNGKALFISLVTSRLVCPWLVSCPKFKQCTRWLIVKTYAWDFLADVSTHAPNKIKMAKQC